MVIGYIESGGKRRDRGLQILILSIGVLAIAAFVAFMCVRVSSAQQLPTLINPEIHALAWNAVTVNSDGTPCDDLDHYVVAVSQIDADLNATGEPIATVQSQCSTAECQAALDTLLTALPDGPYRLWVQAVDMTGNKSVWSEPLNIGLDRGKPGVPTGLKIKVVVTVEVSN